MDAVTDAPLEGGHSKHVIDPRERRRQLVYFGWSLGIILLINALFISGVLFHKDTPRDAQELLSDPSLGPGVLAP
jgi:hypothetical protein